MINLEVIVVGLDEERFAVIVVGVIRGRSHECKIRAASG